jgi:hypothetical protein
MFHLETELAQWREEMRSAGISPGRVLAELESHLRDDFDRAVKAGTDPVAAFAAAKATLGPAHALKREFDVSSPRTIASIFRAPIPLFPTNLRWCAFAALLFGPMMMINVVQNIANNWVSFKSCDLAQFLNFVALDLLILPFLFGVLGLAGAIYYLWKPAYWSGCLLGAFWIYFLWSRGFLLVMVLVYGSHLDLSDFCPADFASMMVVGAVARYFWNKALRGEAKKASAPREDDQRLPS